MEDALLPLAPAAHRAAPPSGNCSSFAPNDGERGTQKEREREREGGDDASPRETPRAGRVGSNCSASLGDASLCARRPPKRGGAGVLAGTRSIDCVTWNRISDE